MRFSIGALKKPPKSHEVVQRVAIEAKHASISGVHGRLAGGGGGGGGGNSTIGTGHSCEGEAIGRMGSFLLWPPKKSPQLGP